MPTTYTLISSNVLTSSAASVTFSAIPATYTDLVLRISARSSASATTATLLMQFNSITSGYSETNLYANSSNSPGSTQGSSLSTIGAYGFFLITGDTATASTFSNVEYYIPSYTVSQNKPVSGMTTPENNATVFVPRVMAALMSNTATISGVTFTLGAGNFMSGSSFYLYGISNA
jgi:hypothetical protein